MALPARLARYQSLLDLLVDAALREMEAEADDISSAAAREAVSPRESDTPSDQLARPHRR